LSAEVSRGKQKTADISQHQVRRRRCAVWSMQQRADVTRHTSFGQQRSAVGNNRQQISVSIQHQATNRSAAVGRRPVLDIS